MCLDFELTLSQSIAEFIRQQEGVVIAEQLAYFIPSPPLLPAVLSSSAPTTSSELSLQLNQQNQIVDESWILPTLLRYNGRPTVTEDGHIVYIFDELMLSAANLGTTAPPTTEVNSGLVRNPILLSEQEWKFSQAPPAQLGKVTLLATANLVGIIMLSQMLPQSNLIRGKHKEMAYFIQKVMLTYIVVM